MPGKGGDGISGEGSAAGGDVQNKGSGKSFLAYLYVGVDHSLQNIGMRAESDLKVVVTQKEVGVELRTASGLNAYTKCIWLHA
ncbi:hypothetical protein FIBSPDRAFT_857142 [Athelia psychrophila]|uniref:Uncharacterized protein n=1 Tax=Athelia psychrophila TaxID=1759441 RepID=A0A166MY32_9AGAM|nr:hypothetical protein FIBSPDRAFT_857142 [Fibularhizoctonia sp. CBS 109695]